MLAVWKVPIMCSTFACNMNMWTVRGLMVRKLVLGSDVCQVKSRTSWVIWVVSDTNQSEETRCPESRLFRGLIRDWSGCLTYFLTSLFLSPCPDAPYSAPHRPEEAAGPEAGEGRGPGTGLCTRHHAQAQERLTALLRECPRFLFLFPWAAGTDCSVEPISCVNWNPFPVLLTC